MAKIYEALAEEKTLKARLQQLSEFRKSSNTFDADTNPDFQFDDLTEKIDVAFERLTELKLAIQSANLANNVKVQGADMPLARAILELSNARAKLGYVADMMREGRHGLFDREFRKSDEVPLRWQKTRPELLELQEKYEERKNALDSAIQETNNRLTVAV